MSILGKIVAAAATKAVIKTVGEVAVTTTGGVLDEVDRHRGKQEERLQNAKFIKASNMEDFIGEHYLKVRAALIAYGFTDISFVAKRDLRKGWLIKDGEVEEISINGSTEFGKKAKFSSASPVVIVYHTFIDDNRNNDHINTSLRPVPTESTEKVIFCSHCGARQKFSNRFCSVCGNKLLK